jgi:SAM-dependent methyltransferase
MDDFIKWNDWWSQKYRFRIGEGVRYFTTKIALNIFHYRKGTNIVETGTIRALDDMAGGGYSTLLFGDYAQHYKKKFWTVDILPEAIELSKKETEGFNSTTNFVISDSVKFLEEFPEKIDLLYLDSMDCPEYDEAESPALVASQEHQLKEIKAAWDKLHAGSVILLDDNNFENGGKCKLSVEYLLGNGWTPLMADKQVLLIQC